MKQEYEICQVCAQDFTIPFNIPKCYNIYTRCTTCFILEYNKINKTKVGNCYINLCKDDFIKLKNDIFEPEYEKTYVLYDKLG
jgi:hypothetical protein